MLNINACALGTPHGVARCCWCQRVLVVGQVTQLRCWLCPTCWPRQVKYALRVGYGARDAARLGLEKAGEYCWHVPLPAQVAPYEWSEEYPGYFCWGGIAGVGKSTASRHWLYWRSLMVEGHEGLLLRENWEQLRDNHTMKMAAEVPQLGGVWKESERLAVFGTGSAQSVIRCGHMAEASAVLRYMGIEYDAIVADEGALYPVGEDGISVLSQLYPRARKTHRTKAGATGASVVLVPTNPGGHSSDWLKTMHRDHAPDYEASPQLRPEYDAAGRQVGGYMAERWQFLPTRIEDNPYLREDYARTDLAMHGEVRYKQLAQGDWDVTIGQFFPEWDASVHVRETAWL